MKLDCSPKTFPTLPSHWRTPSQTLRLMLLSSALWLAACGGLDSGPVCTNTSTATCIGTSGGTVSGPNGASVAIPALALTTVTAITVQQDATGSPSLPAGTSAAGLVWQLLPHGTAFVAPVTLSLPFDPTTLPAGVAPRLFKAQPGGAYVEVTPITVNGNFITAQVNSFSFFALITNKLLTALPTGSTQDGMSSLPNPVGGNFTIGRDGSIPDVKLLSFSSLPNPVGGNFSLEECVKDNLTGLTWEGKTATGTRADSATFTNYDNSAQAQFWNGTVFVTPTQTDIDAATNAVGYKNAVNARVLCGYTDWRLPTVDELQSLVEIDPAYVGQFTYIAWFPNSVVTNSYWSASPYVGPGDLDWGVVFKYGPASRGRSFRVRLVR